MCYFFRSHRMGVRVFFEEFVFKGEGEREKGGERERGRERGGEREKK